MTSPFSYTQSITSAPIESTMTLAPVDMSTVPAHLPPLRRGSGSSKSGGRYRPHYTPTSSPQVMSATLDHPGSGTPLSKIDPRLIGLVGPSPILAAPTSASRTSPPAILPMTSYSSMVFERFEVTAGANHFCENGVPSSPAAAGYYADGTHSVNGNSAIPRIGSLVNRAGTMINRGFVDTAGSDKSASRASRRSPGAASNGTGTSGGHLPTEIHTERISNVS